MYWRLKNREWKEGFCIRQMKALDRLIGNQYPDNWDFIKEWSDKDLDLEIRDTIAQLRFEKGIEFKIKAWTAVWTVIIVVIIGMVVLGFIGLLLFGIRQIFPDFLK